MKKFKTLKEQFIELVCDRCSLIEDDLTMEERNIIDVSFRIIEEKQEDIKILSDENKRLNIENSNLKSYEDDKDY